MSHHKDQCEAEHGTAHLPDDVRSAIYHAAWEAGHAYGESEVKNIYPDFGDLALLAFKAAREHERNIVCKYLKGWHGWQAKAIRMFRADLDKDSPLP